MQLPREMRLEMSCTHKAQLIARVDSVITRAITLAQGAITRANRAITRGAAITRIDYMASSMSGQDKPNPAL